MFEYFCRYKQKCPSPLKLVLTGHCVESVPDAPDISYLGYVSEAQKSALMKQATVFVQPSPFESFSIALLEAFYFGRPALVNGESAVMSEHCSAAKAGFSYRGYAQFEDSLSKLLQDDGMRRSLGENGQKYVVDNYSTSALSAKLKRVLEETPTLTPEDMDDG